MPKRFTDTEKWKKDFIKSLTPELKLIWFYITDDCDHAGVWQVEWDILKIRCGVDVDIKHALSCFGEKIQVFDDGKKWFITDFIEFQYGELNEKNRMHKSVISKIQSYKNKGLISPLEGAKDKDKVKDKVKVIDGGMGEDVKFPIEHCAEIAMKDERWVKANKATEPELKIFNGYLEQVSEYLKNPLDYKRHFANFKHKYPDRLKPNAKSLSLDEWRQLAREYDKLQTA